MEKMFKFLDATAKNEMLPIFEILFQCAGKSGMRPPGPRFILSDDVINDVTESFIESTVKAVGTEVKCGGDGESKRWFYILVGSDNGRLNQQMPNAHPEYFRGQHVMRIEIIKWVNEKPKDSKRYSLLYVIGQQEKKSSHS